MAQNPHKLAVSSAISMNDRIGSLFDQIGSETGAVTVAYKNARRALPYALTEINPKRATREIQSGLGQTVQQVMDAVSLQAVNLGIQEASDQLQHYGIQAGSVVVPPRMRQNINLAADMVLSQVEEQFQKIQTMLSFDMSEGEITGDEHNSGVLRASDVIAAAAFWLAALVWDAYDYWIQDRGKGRGFQKQAIAALDARTTDCCLRVHGQIRSLNTPFELTGVPRFANEIDWPPFHYYCRTSAALYLPGYDDGLTAIMQDGARKFLDARERGVRLDRHPADGLG